MGDSLNSSSRLSTARWPSPSRLLASSAVSEVTSTRSSHRTSPTSKPSTWSTFVPPSSHSSKPSLRKVSSLKPPRQLSRTWLSATLKLTWPPSKWCKSRGDTILKNAKNTNNNNSNAQTDRAMFTEFDRPGAMFQSNTHTLSLPQLLLTHRFAPSKHIKKHFILATTIQQNVLYHYSILLRLVKFHMTLIIYYFYHLLPFFRYE